MGRILIVEDNPANLEVMAYLLRAYGHEVETALDGLEGREAANREKPDLILMDLQMPQVDGYAAMRLITSERQIRASTPQPLDDISWAAEPALRHGTERGTILAVDDTPTNLLFLRAALEPFGYRVLAARSVDEALSLAGMTLPDLVISDLHMPVRTGFDLIRSIKADQALSHLEVIIHSATVSTPADERTAIALGAAGCISRPLTPELVLEAVRRHLRPEGSTREAQAPGESGSHASRRS